ncbi:TPA: glycosyltransferase family 4 protein [Vibrio parahaemolyticus]|nr:glycosyltransferase family 4 protein [Vibrio parahaemolyticus]
MKKKICFFVGGVSAAGGTERVASLIANSLIDFGLDVKFISLDGTNEPYFSLNAPIIPLAIDKGVNRHLSIIQSVRRVVKSEGFDVFIDVDTMLSFYSVPSLVGLNVKHISWEHFNFYVNFNLLTRRISRYIAALFCDHIVTLTKKDEGYWKKNTLGKAKISTIPNPLQQVPLGDTYNKTPSLEHKTILAVGRLTYQKGFDLLLKAWSLVDKQGWSLKIVGDGEDRASLVKLSDELNLNSSVRFLPATKNIDVEYRSASFFCLSSRFEGFGMVILEALGHGLPVASFDCDAGPSDMIIEDRNGKLVPCESIEELASVLTTFLNMSNDEYDYFSKNAQEKSRDFYIDKIRESWLSIL